jgi:hypothetical protein
MIFLTKKQLEDVARQIASISVKDTDFEETHELNDNDVVAIVQDGVNKIIGLDELGTYYAGINDQLTADNEDITIVNNTLKFANRSATDDESGYRILRDTASFASQVTNANTIYEVRYGFDLGGATVTMPANCTLKFNGGVLSNGTLVCQNTSFVSDGQKCVDTNLVLSGTFASPLKLSLFGIAGSNSSNAAIWKATTFPARTAYDVDSDVVFSAGDIEIPRTARIKGNGHRFTFTASSATNGLLLMSYRCFVEGLDVYCSESYAGSIVVASTPYNDVHDFRLANMTISGIYSGSNLVNDYYATGLKIYADNSTVVSGAISGCVIDNVRFEWLKHGINVSGVNYAKTNPNDYCWLNSLFFNNIYIISTHEGIVTDFVNNGGDTNKPTAIGNFYFSNVEYQARIKEYEEGYEPTEEDGVQIPGIDGVHQSLLLQKGNFGFNTYISDSICWDTSCLARVMVGALYTRNVRSVGAYDNGENIKENPPVYRYVYPATGSDDYSTDYGDYTLKHRIVKLYGDANLFRDYSGSNKIDLLCEDYTQASGSQRFIITPHTYSVNVNRQDIGASLGMALSQNDVAAQIYSKRTTNNFIFKNSDDSTSTQYIQWLAKNPGSTQNYKFLDFRRQAPVFSSPGALGFVSSSNNREVYTIKAMIGFVENTVAKMKITLKFLDSNGNLENYTNYLTHAVAAPVLGASFHITCSRANIKNIRYATESNELVVYFDAEILETVTASSATYFYMDVKYSDNVSATNVTTSDEGIEYVNRSKTDFVQNATIELLDTVYKAGVEGNRPAGSSIYVGYQYFDTTAGKPIYASSIDGDTVTWVDASGETV